MGHFFTFSKLKSMAQARRLQQHSSGLRLCQGDRTRSPLQKLLGHRWARDAPFLLCGSCRQGAARQQARLRDAAAHPQAPQSHTVTLHAQKGHRRRRRRPSLTELMEAEAPEQKPQVAEQYLHSAA
jgi:hypothetical protein